VPDYARTAATVERLINKTGRTVTVVQLESGSDDAAEPWNAKAVPRDVATEVELKGTYVSHRDLAALGFISEERAAQLMSKSALNKVALFSAKTAGTNLLDEFHEVIDDSVRYKIDRAHVLQPGDIRLLYALELSR